MSNPLHEESYGSITPQILGLVGPIYSGKRELAEYVCSHLACTETISISKFALIDAKKTSSHRIDTLSNNKAEIREYINTKRHMYGNDYFLRQMNLKSIVNKTLVIVRSLKTVAEVDYIHSIGGRVVGLTADQHIRYNRSQNEEALQGFNFEYFKTLEKTEFPEMDEAYEKADYKYVNNYQKTSKKDEVDLFHIGPCSDVLNKIAYMYPELDRDHDRFDAKFEDFLMKHA